MWICPSCGEPHQDQFKECWKCVGAEMPDHLSEAEAPSFTPAGTAPETRLRPIGSFLVRAAAGFLLGALISVGISQRAGQSFSQASLGGLSWGLVCGAAVGVIGWVFFPYRPTEKPNQAEQREQG
jgi:hypothetical protein